ncbi:hypothetical protein HYH03_004822 [Edaphochlamys debaryana]|uniref:Apoptosis antagonizing transcription factor n=1 Tax=Edaphochlamys debaryana TaxID=47281 RepID=A0A836C2Y9_9CHLO|nr:hypothetical protein HYH03_004822 [Edaphochlamys debaryana]|eukprot:KAG2497233.1 hypothetical protein HYH03_004822 [Edaphochlamys debaryana]
MAPKKKSLAQELAELINPAPAREHDPDALDLGDGAQLAGSDGEDDFDAGKAPSKRAPEKAMLLRGDITLEDAAYRGRKTSRAAMFGDVQDDEDDDEDEDDIGLDLSGGEDEDDEDEEEEAAGQEERRAAGGRAGASGRAGAAAPAQRGRAGAAAAKGAAADSEEGAEGDEDDEEEDDEDGFLEGGTEEEGEEADEDARGTGTGTGTGSGSDGEEEAGRRPAKRGGGAAAGPRQALPGEDPELLALEAELDDLAEAEEEQAAALRRKAEKDRVKGVAVRAQQVLYERALENRILLQKCLQASNGLPRPPTHAALQASRPDVAEGYARLASAARNTLGQLLGLQRELMGRVPDITLPPAPSPAPGSKRAREESEDADEEDQREGGTSSSGSESLDELWQRLSAHHDALAPYRDASVDSWHRRTVLSSGAGALRNAGLRALHQAVSAQVAALMRDPGKAIKRTRLALSACPRVLCEPPRAGPTPAAALAAAVSAAAAAAGAAAPSATEAIDATGEEEARDSETYDDAEFYSQLLKEFLDKGLSSGAAAGAPRAAKKRKVVDRRASKGRKLRYHVQEKLVAFMAPVEMSMPPFAENLFANLFGHAAR